MRPQSAIESPFAAKRAAALSRKAAWTPAHPRASACNPAAAASSPP